MTSFLLMILLSSPREKSLSGIFPTKTLPTIFEPPRLYPFAPLFPISCFSFDDFSFFLPCSDSRECNVFEYFSFHAVFPYSNDCDLRYYAAPDSRALIVPSLASPFSKLDFLVDDFFLTSKDSFSDGWLSFFSPLPCFLRFPFNVSPTGFGSGAVFPPIFFGASRRVFFFLSSFSFSVF